MRRMIALTVATLAACLTLAFASPAGAVENPNYTVPPPSEPVGSTPQGEQYQVVNRTASPGRTSVAESRQRLPITGSDVTGIAVIGGLLVAGGAVLLTIRRRSLPTA
jgi:LPXTG-motif cell wall-anchored protein